MPEGKHYNKEFRLGAARLVTEQGYTQRKAFERLGISARTIGGWIRDLQASGDQLIGSRICAAGFNAACALPDTATCASCSAVVPYLAIR